MQCLLHHHGRQHSLLQPLWVGHVMARGTGRELAQGGTFSPHPSRTPFENANSNARINLEHANESMTAKKL